MIREESDNNCYTVASDDNDYQELVGGIIQLIIVTKVVHSQADFPEYLVSLL